ALPRPVGMGRVFAKSLGLVLALAAVVLAVGLASGGRDVLQPLSHLARAGMPGGAAAGMPTDAPGRMAAAGNIKDRFVKVRASAELDALLAASVRPSTPDFHAACCRASKELEP